MANEAQIGNTLRINTAVATGYIKFSETEQFNVTVTGANGPTPGAVSVATAGTDISLSQLTTPGLCKIKNLDPTNYISYGIWNGANYYPLGELFAGESVVLRLARDVGSTLRCKANTAACKVFVGAFEK